ncbi:MAG: hypothetical protein IBX55_01965 [Methyloprofundus sp.]|nr:hypothetical protein [Methyloprofundus sp.]
MDEYIVDERVGCVAVYLKSRADETPGCHADDDRNIFYAVGVRDSNGAWAVPQELLDRAAIVCKEANERLKPMDAMKCEQFNPRPLELPHDKKALFEQAAILHYVSDTPEYQTPLELIEAWESVETAEDFANKFTIWQPFEHYEFTQIQEMVSDLAFVMEAVHVDVLAVGES